MILCSLVHKKKFAKPFIFHQHSLHSIALAFLGRELHLLSTFFFNFLLSINYFVELKLKNQQDYFRHHNESSREDLSILLFLRHDYKQIASTLIVDFFNPIESNGAIYPINKL